MNDCAMCGKPVRLRAMKLTAGRRRGVMHYIEHVDGSQVHSEQWVCSAFKPYPRVDADQPWMQMMARWDAEQAALVAQVPR